MIQLTLMLRTISTRLAAPLALLILGAPAGLAAAQDVSAALGTATPLQEPTHDHAAMTAPGWTFMWDGVVLGTYNHQGGPRGGDEFRSQNWVMGMTTRPVGRGTLTLNGMISLEPATVGGRGYRELFQMGEAYKGLPVTDRQHPHNFFMQLAAVWRQPIGERLAFTLAGGPVGEPALGPIAYPHRASAAENSTAPISHHTFDSTHVTMGVVTGALEVGPLTFEGSVFRGRESDDRRYRIELGKLDSASGRAWWRATRELEFQISYGYLHEPEQLEPGDQRRANASLSWLRQRPSGFTAATVVIGQADRTWSITRAILLEGTHRVGRTAVYGRYEGVAVETEHLLFPQLIHKPHPGELLDPVHALTLGGVRDVATVNGVSLGLGADATFYRVPDRLVATHGENPVSFHVFFRIRPPTPAMGRMWNHAMARPMDHSMPAAPDAGAHVH